MADHDGTPKNAFYNLTSEVMARALLQIDVLQAQVDALKSFLTPEQGAAFNQTVEKRHEELSTRRAKEAAEIVRKHFPDEH